MEENIRTTEQPSNELRQEQYSHINGWGIDANPEDHPNAPMKHYTGDDHDKLNWARPPLQPVNMEVLKSNEHLRYPATYGTSSPPSGLSGMIRRYAFRYSEGQHRHWLALVVADRVNVVEGILDDLKRGIVPNLFAEKGWKAEWQYNRKAFVTKIAVTVALTSALLIMMNKNNKSKKRKLLGLFGG